MHQDQPSDAAKHEQMYIAYMAGRGGEGFYLTPRATPLPEFSAATEGGVDR